uniref:Uncharacterized protein n=1 Tax=Oryza sativa subsp. japonica TaxID=39947 RepID=Q6Z3B9_ORYSJ|nr:hypothetical protein [Oryza sativa Japonica Group]BAD31612.1 hypothetical protein [Oryza sativa Japonica Group]
MKAKTSIGGDEGDQSVKTKMPINGGPTPPATRLADREPADVAMPPRKRRPPRHHARTGPPTRALDFAASRRHARTGRRQPCRLRTRRPTAPPPVLRPKTGEAGQIRRRRRRICHCLAQRPRRHHSPTPANVSSTAP